MKEHRGRSGDLVIGKGNIYHGGAAKAKAYRGFAQMSADRAKTYHGEERRKPILTTDDMDNTDQKSRTSLVTITVYPRSRLLPITKY
jgi:hypothetical protein